MRRIAKRHRFFHWALQFPEVFNGENGGFDVELMNPPWERIKLQEKEWFAAAKSCDCQRSKCCTEADDCGAEVDDPALWQAFQQ